MSAVTTFSPISGSAPAPASDGRPVAPPTDHRPAMMRRTDSLSALREGATVALGSLLERGHAAGERLVSAVDLEDRSWWIPAAAVWLDGDEGAEPEHPRPVGLATGPDRTRALVAGLADRLGWEAVLELERGGDLAPAPEVTESLPEHVIVLDGRLGHDVPTVVVLGPDFVRWGAGATWDAAVRRALYGGEGLDGVEAEFEQMRTTLASRGLAPVVVELDTPLLRRAGIFRCSVQLLAV